MVTIAQSLAQFTQDYIKTCENETGNLPQVTHDETWRSPCEDSSPVDGELVNWQAVAQNPPFNFCDIESALELSIHEDIKSFYSLQFSGSLFGLHDNLQCELLQCWNDEDVKRLGQNIVGHTLMQRKLKQRHTIFIGCLVNSEKMICVDNDTGAVVLEIAGQDERESIAPSLSSFLCQLTPLASPDNELAYQAPIEIKAGLMPRLKELMRSLLGK